MKRISFFPLDLSDDNSYISRMYQAIKLAEKDVVVANLDIKRNWNFFIHSDIFWLNWYENIDHRSIYTTIYSILRKLVELFLMKILRGKIFFVFHNKQPHEVSFYRLTIWFMRYLLRCSDVIVVLCDESRDVINNILNVKSLNKVVKISHPAYKCIPKQYPSCCPNKFVVLFLGLIRPYKNIELILELALKYPEFDFVISGMICDTSYGDMLKDKAERVSNIYLEYKHNTDEELNKLMEEASVLVLPYHKASSLNSGMAMYAFSKGLNVVMPEIGTVKELKNRDLVFSYSYKNPQDHFMALEESLLKAYNLYINDYDNFVMRAQTIRKEVEYTCSLKAVGNQIREAISF